MTRNNLWTTADHAVTTILVGVTGFLATPIQNIGAGRRVSLRLRTSDPFVFAVGVTGFEPATPCAQGRCATRLRHTPRKIVDCRFSINDRKLHKFATQVNPPENSRYLSVTRIAQFIVLLHWFFRHTPSRFHTLRRIRLFWFDPTTAKRQRMSVQDRRRMTDQEMRRVD